MLTAVSGLTTCIVLKVLTCNCCTFNSLLQQCYHKIVEKNCFLRKHCIFSFNIPFDFT